MVLTNEDLLAISQLLDTKLDAKLEPLKVDIQGIKNDVLSIKLDIELLKKVVTEHSEKLQRIS